MKVLVIGASGLVGSHVLAEAQARGHEVCGTYRNNPREGLVSLDLANEAATRTLLNTFRPDWVVHAAGWTWVDGCENDAPRAFRENRDQPAALAHLCRERGIRFAYFSTTYVFDGTAGPYSEEDYPNPINVYARSKWEAEQKIQTILDGRALIPRVICVWGRESQQKNFVYQALRALRENRVLSLPADQLGNPTWAGDIAGWLLLLMENGERGVWNLAGANANCTRVNWFMQIRAALVALGAFSPDRLPACEGVLTEALKQAAKRPLHSGADTAKIQRRFSRKPREPHEIAGIIEIATENSHH